MYTLRKISSSFIREYIKQRKRDKNSNFSNPENDSSCLQVYNGCLTRLKLIEMRLNEILNENYLPSFEDVVEHLRRRPNDSEELSSFSLDSKTCNTNGEADHNFMTDFDMNVSIVSNKSEAFDETFPIKNPEFLLKEFLSIISEFIQMTDRAIHQFIIEKASVYFLWVFYDVYRNNFENLPSTENPTSFNFSCMNSHYSTFEYIFCTSSFNFDLIEKLYVCSRCIFKLMEPKFLNQIFFYPITVKSAIADIENQEPNYDWFKNFTEEFFQNEYINEGINPFELSDINSMLITEDDEGFVSEVSQDFSRFNFDYSNSEFILQSLLYSNINLKSKKKNSNENQSQLSKQEYISDSSKYQSTENVLAELYTDLSNFIQDYNSKHDESYYLNNEELYNAILNWLIKSTDDNSLAKELTNLLGENSLQLITKIITFYKLKIKSNVDSTNLAQNYPDNNNKTRNNKRAEHLWQMICQARDTGTVSVRPSVVVHTAKEKALKKEMRKIEKKYNKELNKVQKNSNEDEFQSEKLSLDDLEKMRQRNLKASIRAVFQPKYEARERQFKPVEKYPHVYDLFLNVKNTASYIAETKLLLPVGSQRKELKTYDEVTIPIIATNEETHEFLKNFPQLEIADTDEFIKTAFKGFKKLNIIQSVVFSTAYFSGNQNMLICAPTGAGKTNIAMLSILNILRTFSNNGNPNQIELNQFKIIYIAPMKALCAEMTSTFANRLESFNIKVRELTGDMQMTSKEIMETQMLVVTPEKWDVVTRKSVGDVQLMDLVRLIIIDEVHLLQSDRGHVLETLVARTVRYVEQSQKYIRIIGLSATLPNYVDVALFLRVDPYDGLFVFDDRFRPVPLKKTFIGVKAPNNAQLNIEMDDLTISKTKDILRKEYQVMIFVHSRNATMQLANFLLTKTQYDDASNGENLKSLFVADTSKLPGSDKLISRAKYRNLNKFLLNGIGVHHAGMPRSERNVVEKLFKHGVIKVLVCTSTLAWGVNLPAHSVIIRGTEYYDPSQGHHVDIDMLDVMQIFGRAGRPQFDTDGEATIITNHSKLPYYLNMLTNQLPIESRFLKRLTDNLNAEIALGTVSSIREAIEWLRYTYLYIRIPKNPLEYGLKQIASMHLPLIEERLNEWIQSSAEQLDRAQMIRYSPEADGLLESIHLGRIASHFYIQHETIVHFNEKLQSTMDIGQILTVLAEASEFQQLRCRDEEIEHLEKLLKYCPYPPKHSLCDTPAKVNILMQSAISRATTDCHSLSSDLTFIVQNVSRLARGLFDYHIRKACPSLAQSFLEISLMFEKRIWDYDTPFWQFDHLGSEILQKLSSLHRQGVTPAYLRQLSSKEIGERLRDKKSGSIIKKLLHVIPNVTVEAKIKPITRTILTVYIDVEPDFTWDDKHHGKAAQIYWIWLTDIQNNHIYHSELGRFTKKQVVKRECQRYVFAIPLAEDESIQKQYFITCAFEYWKGAIYVFDIPCNTLILPDKQIPNTKLLNLMPLPIKALQNDLYQSIYSFTHFNPIQTQIFHTLYHTDNNVLLGAPTGSGKTIAAEIALFRVVNTNPQGKIVYIAPLKALVRERVDDWKKKIERKIGLSIVELTGDVTPDLATIDSANVIVTTPEKWDGVSRGWTFRKFVRQVSLIIIDEIHLLGEDRGPVLEVIVSRANFICRRTTEKIRIIGLSTAVANAQDLSSWLGIQKIGLYNFSPSVRPVPIEVHGSGFPGKHYCPRMASMNKPAYRAIKQYSPDKPVLIFVSSRRQTRLTAMDLITLLAGDDHSTGLSFLKIQDQDELDNILEHVKDSYLKDFLRFGIGMHHAGLNESDRKLVENLFSEQKIQVLITTATLAWGINLPAHAVIIKGTEYFDGKQGRYVDFPITDVLQMVGRAGRPQFDTSAVAVLLLHDIKKEYFMKFLYEPFPVESQLLDVFPDHLNAEIMAGTVKTKHEAMEYLSSTYLYHRIIKNPSYYGVDLSEFDHPDELVVNTQVIKFLSSYIDKCVALLIDHYCISIQDQKENFDDDEYQEKSTNYSQIFCPTPLGKIASYYYLSYKTISMFQDKLSPLETVSSNAQFVHLETSKILDLLTQSVEYSTLPVRHNEELMNQSLSQKCPFKVNQGSFDSPYTKANLLIQAHCSRIPFPIVDYYTDLKTVLDQVIRILQAMIDVSALNGSLPTTINIINLQQNISQASWQHSNQLLMLMEIESHHDCCFEDDIDDNHGNSQSNFAYSQISNLPLEMCSIPVLLNFIYKKGRMAENSFHNLLNQFSIHRAIIQRIYNSLLNFPIINLEKITINKINDEFDQDFEESFEVSKENTFRSPQDIKWISLQPQTEYLIVCHFKKTALNGIHKNKAFCPNFPKPKSESWYLILGVQENSELITITRVPCINYSTQINIRFRTPDLTGEYGQQRRIFYTLYLLSDSYIGLDQQYSLPLQIHSL